MTAIDSSKEEKAQRKKIRLPADCYRGGDCFHLTVCAAERGDVINERQKRVLKEILERQQVSNGGPVYGWVLMPDHIHVLVYGARDVVDWVKIFKSSVTSSLRRRGIVEFGWQRSFHDHGLRKNEHIEEVARYILENPVRAGLCGTFADWPWSYMFGVKE